MTTIVVGAVFGALVAGVTAVGLTLVLHPPTVVAFLLGAVSGSVGANLGIVLAVRESSR